MTAQDPYYHRKPVPDEFIEHVGYSGISPAEETINRERKFSTTDGDIRSHSWQPKGKSGNLDPYYQRKPVPESLIKDIGYTGLSKEEEYLNRERKYSVTGSDVRKFSDGKGGLTPSDDPYYNRKSVAKAQIHGVGDTNMTAAEEFETRENKASKVDFSSDPFQLITGQGHRQSVSGMAAPAAAQAARRRSSAVAPDFQQPPQSSGGYGTTGQVLEPIQSRADDEIRPSTDIPSSSTGPSVPVTVRDNTGHATGPTGHTTFYDAATKELDSVDPHTRA